MTANSGVATLTRMSVELEGSRQRWEQAWQQVRDALWDQTPEEEIIGSVKVNEMLLAMQADLAEHRRQAVRELRMAGWTLRSIAEATGLTHQRISQLEAGMDRKDKM